MAILTVKTLGDPVLRRKAETVTTVTPELLRLAEDMLETMYGENGVGLAAPQVGMSVRMFVCDPGPAEGGARTPQVFFNPVLTDLRGKDLTEEGCLSLPGIRAEVERATALRLRAMNTEGSPVEREIAGYLARIVQHETDHVNGILFVDRLGAAQRTLLSPAMKELEKKTKSGVREMAQAGTGRGRPL